MEGVGIGRAALWANEEMKKLKNESLIMVNDEV